MPGGRVTRSPLAVTVSSWGLGATVLVMGAAPVTPSVSPAGRAGAPPWWAAPAPVTWVRWVDPTEHAFALDAPAGWTVRGGVKRRGPNDYRNDVVMQSPDGAVTIRLGDADIPLYAVQTPLMQQLGMRLGTVYNAGYGQTALIVNYETGAQFARHYGQRMMSAACHDVSVDSVRRATVSLAMKPPATIPSTITAGVVLFSCHDKPLRGYTYANTTLIGAPQTGGNWYVYPLLAYTAPVGRVAEVRGLLAHIVASLAVNPEWWRAQGQRDAAWGNMVRKGWEKQEAVNDHQFTETDNLINGVETAVDPTTGKNWDVPIDGHAVHWLDGQNHMAATDGPSPPPIKGDWRQLKPAPPSPSP
jgi:hypothetical protein